MKTLKYLLADCLKIGVVIAILWAVLAYFPIDMRSSTQIAAEARIDHLNAQLSRLSQMRTAEELGAAGAYGESCGFPINDTTWENVLRLSNISQADILGGGRLRAEYVTGIERIAKLIHVDSGDRILSCSMGRAAFGPEGTILQDLLTAAP